MKKLISLLIVFMFAFSAASAEGLFGNTLPTLSVECVSYGVRMNAEPSFTETLDDGTVKEVYKNVTTDDYYAFGTILGEDEYSISEQEQIETGVVLTLVKENTSFRIEYDMVAETLTVFYPKGVKIEQKKIPDPFEGYTRIEFGEEIRVGKSIIKFTEFHIADGLEITRREEKRSSVGKTFDTVQFDTWLKGTIDNREVNSIDMCKLCNTEIFYINEDNCYGYGSDKCGIIDPDNKWIDYTHYFDTGYTHPYVSFIDSLECKEFGIGFEINDRVKNAKDGILAITIEFSDDSKYVLYIREQ